MGESERNHSDGSHSDTNRSDTNRSDTNRSDTNRSDTNRSDTNRSEREPTDQAPKFVVVSAASALGPSLQSALQVISGLQVVTKEAPLEAVAQLDPDLIVIEITDTTEHAAHLLVESNPRAAVVLVGPLGLHTNGAQVMGPRKLRELSADVSVAEVVRVCRGLLYGEEAQLPLASRVSEPRIAAVQVLPRASEPPPSMHSLPAPLLPSSQPPSSRPSGPAAVSPSAQPAPSLVEDNSQFSPTEYSQELQRILADAERRVLSGLRQRPTLPPQGRGGVHPPPNLRSAQVASNSANSAASSLSAALLGTAPGDRNGSLFGESGEELANPARLAAELRAALELPIGEPEFGATSGKPEPVRPARTGNPSGGSQLPTIVGDGEELLTSGVASRSTSHHSSLPPGDSDVGTGSANSDTASHPEAATAKPPPPGRSTSGGRSDATSIELPDVPPPPGLPRGAWVGQALGTSDGPVSEDYETGDGEESVRLPQRPAPKPGTLRRSQKPALASFGRDLFPTVPPRVHPRHVDGASPVPAAPKRPSNPNLEIPPLRPGDGVRLVARAVRERFTGTLTLEAPLGVRRLVLRDGDFVTAASGVGTESLLAFLVKRGLLSHDVEAQLAHRLPSFGRHAGAALIASGHLAQDQLWPILRAHAEFVIANVLLLGEGAAAFEEAIPDRLQAEPAVFGGATGAEVLVEMMRRLIEPERALAELGGLGVEFSEGPEARLLEECALSRASLADLEIAMRYPLAEARSRFSEPEFVCVLYALHELHALSARVGPVKAQRTAQRAAIDRLDVEATRKSVQLRRALVDEGDYFAFLGVPRDATGYAIRSAYLDLRRLFESEALLGGSTVDLADDIALIREVLDEAYEILSDATKRERYLRAIESMP